MSSPRERRKARRRNRRLRDEAWAALREGRPDRARRLIAEVVVDWPLNARSWHDHGVIHLAAGQPREAESSLRHALQLAPSSASRPRASA